MPFFGFLWIVCRSHFTLQTTTICSKPKFSSRTRHCPAQLIRTRKASERDLIYASTSSDVHFGTTRRSTLFAVAACLAVSRQSAECLAIAQPEGQKSLEELLGQIIESRRLLEQVPDLVQKEQWDGVRTLLFRPPIGKLKSIMGAAAEMVGDDALDEYYDLLENLRELDVNVYTNIFVPSARAQVKYTKLALDAYQKSLENLDRFLALISEEDLAAAKKR